jgi:hypothetical protein
MSTAAYGIEAIWEGQGWLLEGFHKLSVAIGRSVAGTFSTAKGEDAIRAADIPRQGPLWTVEGRGFWRLPSLHLRERRRDSYSRLRQRMIQAGTASHGGSLRRATTTGSLRKGDRSRSAPRERDSKPRGQNPRPELKAPNSLSPRATRGQTAHTAKPLDLAGWSRRKGPTVAQGWEASKPLSMPR